MGWLSTSVCHRWDSQVCVNSVRWTPEYTTAWQMSRWSAALMLDDTNMAICCLCRKTPRSSETTWQSGLFTQTPGSSVNETARQKHAPLKFMHQCQMRKRQEGNSVCRGSASHFKLSEWWRCLDARDSLHIFYLIDNLVLTRSTGFTLIWALISVKVT